MADRASGAAWRRRQRRLRSWWRHEQQTMAAVLGYGDPPFVLQGGHRERRPTRTESLAPAPRWVLPSILSSRRTMAGPAGRSGQRHCWSRCRRRRCSGTQASGTKSSRISMFLCCRWWNSCRTSLSSLPRICRWLPSRLSKCRRSCLSAVPQRRPPSAWGTVCVNRRRRTSWWKCPRSCPSFLFQQQTAEQIVDIPVPHRRRRVHGGLQAFTPWTEFNSTYCGADR